MFFLDEKNQRSYLSSHFRLEMSFSNKIIYWYQQNKRDLPWRKTLDPYHIWLSEVILQQTRVEQGMSYYHKFASHFPTIFHLAQAEEETVLKLWQGLGYYSRARNLHHTAKVIVEEYKGIFPKTYQELIGLKGIGDYTASAIASICFNQPQAVVDGNVYRVLSRVFGIKTPINSSRGQKEFKQLAQTLIDKKNPGEYNQALMEFGSLYCKPSKPDCTSCVFSNNCFAFAENKVEILPIKVGKPKIQKRYFHYLVVVSEDNKTLLNKRLGNGIWKNLYEFPLIETETSKHISRKEIEKKLEPIEVKSVVIFNENPIIHKLSHRHLSINFWIVNAQKVHEKGVDITEIEKYPVPVVIEKFISNFGF